MSEHSHIETCASTGLPVCRRMLNMNLALGYAEEFYSLKALAQMHGRSEAEVFELGYDYVQARECFRKEWAKMKSSSECPLPNQCQLETCFPDLLPNAQ
ncbi:MAG: hypothetical protein OXU45_07460 [Candidatus Melainabacteria bacterium]|nr:hypothetical protein [Candidatus Melainabacteria bacterium]